MRHRFRTGLALAVAALLVTGGAAAAPKKSKGKAARAAPPAAAKVAGAAPSAPLELELSVQRATLANGLRLVLHVDHSAPTIAIAVVYDVGSRDEAPGKSGFAHLFEHMMFQGSANVAKGEHATLVAAHGGISNATTGPDATTYYERLPASELALGLWLEADRMRSLDVSQQNFENQRRVVEEELRMSVSNAAYGTSGIRLEELVYQGYRPYEHPTIGSMSELDAAQLPWVAAFHARHYGPNTAVVCVAGDVDPAEATALVHRYFDPIPKVDADPYVEVLLPDQTSPRTADVRDDHARTPGVRYGWAMPAGRTRDSDALRLASLLLAGGESSRLYQILVRDRALAQSVSAFADVRRGPGLFAVEARLTEHAKPAEVERVVEGEIASLAASGPTPAEVEKAHRQAEAWFVLGLQSNLARARRLAEYEAFWGDATLIREELGRVRAVTKDDIERAVAQVLAPTRRTLVQTFPAGYEAAADTPAAPAAPAAKKGAPAGKPGKRKKKP
jgi:predicted Zn-dependent peptidase